MIHRLKLMKPTQINLFFSLIVLVLTGGCGNKKTRNGDEIWHEKHISKFVLKLPPAYLINYSTDSLRIGITNGKVQIQFRPGDFNVDGIVNNNQVVDQSEVNSFKRVILDSTEKNITSLSVCLWDTTTAAHLFHDVKYSGCILSADDLTNDQKDTVMKIFKSLKPLKK
jgi:hypothetical protein